MKQGDNVLVNKDIYRIHESGDSHTLYAPKGTKGVIVDIFKVNQSGSPGKGVLHAKVKDEHGQIMTFRLTSLEKIS